ncbi:hypothetical protein NE237_014698 [Protea cynaroides]|uniref:Uncharacterized protein n=1 Tax=Protea cynaroides TaxID=273540 RepID=A0A9Q0KCK5_9MAGN|nr:hypothetical protein NE237_014698 [Protea cynaroides]
MARPRALGRSAGSFPVVLLPPRERRMEEFQLATIGARPTRPEWAQRSAPIQMELGGLSLLLDLERYYESSSHAYVTDVSIISDHEDPGRASGFHSHHHIDDKSWDSQSFFLKLRVV